MSSVGFGSFLRVLFEGVDVKAAFFWCGFWRCDLVVQICICFRGGCAGHGPKASAGKLGESNKSATTNPGSLRHSRSGRRLLKELVRTSVVFD